MQIGQWMQDAICRILASTPPEILPRIALNVSPIEFRMPDFVSALLARLTAAEIDPRRLVIEVTESLLIERLEDPSAKLETLNDRNIASSIDDFGTGYSSFTYLDRLPVHQFKLDQRFT